VLAAHEKGAFAVTSSLILALFAVLLTNMGGRDQLIVAHLRDRLGASAPLLIIGICTSAIAAAAMAFAGWRIEAMVSDSAETMLVALAMLLAGLELFWPVRQIAPQEPTRSLGAVSLVLLYRQLFDGPRFLIFALAAAYGDPVFAGIGGAIGGSMALALAWMLGRALPDHWPLRRMRYIFGGLIVLLAIVIGLSVREII
jgi:putative Ca2+/H+ antiporter (TMEM165/GDT1 family)